MPPDLVLRRNPTGRVAVIDAETPDERQFTAREALRAYVRRRLVMSLSVRRDGWTLPGPNGGRIEPDSARLLLRPGNPVVDIVARIGMNRIARGAAAPGTATRTTACSPSTTPSHELEKHGVRWTSPAFSLYDQNKTRSNGEANRPP